MGVMKDLCLSVRRDLSMMSSGLLQDLNSQWFTDSCLQEQLCSTKSATPSLILEQVLTTHSDGTLMENFYV
uniref:Uncharacterized protein n=1 Tax=Picea sitchensis TaxID=3332 RepID=A9NR27_PICSI|nr:unknown [Picea sitchensis]